ncbi:helix-turn-helix domain-containing protein [Polluticoccus soli]|uniref:helix-turn-helix domain-containing protein n=1 Tax=Polluticoccus soli TaxID=3034150 RepID=UPI0023E144C0|nr:AraC family transcriptional regulator [Flavipsychrobacter sp. JY13-12]
MKIVADIVQVHTDAPIERVLGQPARVLAREQVSMNSFVHAEWIEVNFADATWPEEHARLNLFPIGDGQFCVQLLYLQYADEPGNANICWIEFRPEFFDQYPLSMLSAEEPFRFDEVREQQFSICSQTTKLLTEIREVQSPSALRKALQQTEIALQMLRRALDCIAMPFTVCPVPACRFLAFDSEREKVLEARKLIEQNVEQSFTIKDLSRRVAMNECYLKKGFKALVGKTIHEFQQDLRIAKAKDMLQQPGFSVSDVANSLGYSSISHFSTAFKKATGLKPCELLR